MRRPGIRVYKCWWGQEGLDLAGAQAVVEAEISGETEGTEGEADGIAVN